MSSDESLRVMGAELRPPCRMVGMKVARRWTLRRRMSKAIFYTKRCRVSKDDEKMASNWNFPLLSEPARKQKGPTNYAEIVDDVREKT